MAKVAWGIELGTSSIKAVKIQVQKDGLEITDLAVIDLPPVDEELEQTQEERLETALSQFKDQHGYKKEPVYISIPGHQSFNRMITLPLLDPKKFRETVQFEAQQQMPISMDDIIWDYQMIDRNPKVGDEVQVSLFAVRKEIVQNYLTLMDTVGLVTAGIQVAPLSIYNFVKHDQKFPKSGVVIDIGANNTDVVIIDENKIWIRNVPNGGNAITKVLADRFKIPFEEAEKLKIKAAKSKQAQKIFGVMKPALRELLSEINRSLGFYKSQNPKVKINHMLLMGSGSHLLGLKKFFEQQLQFPVHKLQHLNKLQLGRSANPETLQNNIATLAVALGLAVQAAERADNTINLVPQERVLKTEAGKKFPIVVVAAVVMAVAALFPLFGVMGVAETATKADKSFGSVEKAAKDQTAQWEAIPPKAPILDEISRYINAFQAYGLSNIADEAMIQVANSKELRDKIAKYNDGASLFPTDERGFDAAFSAIADCITFDGKIDREEMRFAMLEALITYNLDFQTLAGDDGFIDRDEAKRIRLTASQVRSQPVFMNFTPITHFTDFAFSQKDRFNIIDDDPNRVLIGDKAVGPIGQASGGLGAIAVPAADGAAPPIQSRAVYRNRAYGAQMMLAIPIDKDVLGTAEQNAFAVDMLNFITQLLDAKLAELLKNHPDVQYEARVDTQPKLSQLPPNSRTATLAQLVNPSGINSQNRTIDAPFVKYRPVALAVKLQFRNPLVGTVESNSTASKITAVFPASVLPLLNGSGEEGAVPGSATRRFTMTSGSQVVSKLKIEVDGTGAVASANVEGKRVRLTFTPDGETPLTTLPSPVEDLRIYISFE